MTTAATSLLGLALPVTGELSGTWGDTVNNSITSLLDTAVAGTTTLSTDADVTLTTTTLASNQARQAILLCSGARTGIKTITAPAQSKIYTIINATTGGFAVKLVGVGPTTGLTIPNGASAVVAWNGSDFIEIGSSTVGNLTVNGNLTVTGTSTLTGAATLTANPTLSAGTANGVAYLNGSKVVTTGSALAYDGTTLKVQNNNAVTPVFQIQSYASVGTAIANITYDQGTDIYKFSNPSTFAGSGIDFGTGASSTTRYHIDTGGTSIWSVGGSESMRLTSTGLGIGTSSPGYALDVRRGAGVAAYGVFTGNASSDPLFIGQDSSGLARMFLNGANPLTFWTNATERMRLDSSGNLGIGTTTTSTGKLIASVGSSHVFNVELNGSTLGSTNGVLLTNYLSQTTRVAGINLSATAADAGAIIFGTASGGTLSERARIDSSGNVGIGTSSPGYKLDIYAASLPEMRIRDATVTYQCYTNTTEVTMGTVGSHPMVFRTAATERMRLDSSGNLGLGVTPSAWSTGSTMEVGIYSKLSSSGTYGGALANNAYYNAGWKYAGANYATLYQTVSGAHSWHIAPSGAGAGSAITFTQAMTLDASGQLAIGVTSADTTALRIVPTDTSSVQRTLHIGYNGTMSSGTTGSYISFGNTTPSTNQLARIASYYEGGTYSGSLRFYTNAGTDGANPTERARIDSSGNLLVGQTTTSKTNNGVQIYSASGNNGRIDLSKTASGLYSAIANYYNGTYVGGVDYSNTATSFPTSSDIRLKKDILDAGSASEKINQIRIVAHGWKHDDATVEFGVIAQELVNVAPQAVNPGDDGENVEKTWGVDYSKLVPMLIKAHQEQQTLITQLTERITALESK